jgi:hypothetical protein
VVVADNAQPVLAYAVAAAVAVCVARWHVSC